MQPVYATPGQWAEYLDQQDPPARAEYWLRLASRDVDVALIGAVYDVEDATQQPTDPDVAAVLLEATCEQADYLRDVNDPSGAKRRWQTVKVGQASYSRRSGAAGTEAEVARRAADALRLAGLTPQVWTAGWCP